MTLLIKCCGANELRIILRIVSLRFALGKNCAKEHFSKQANNALLLYFRSIVDLYRGKLVEVAIFVQIFWQLRTLRDLGNLVAII